MGKYGFPGNITAFRAKSGLITPMMHQSIDVTFETRQQLSAAMLSFSRTFGYSHCTIAFF